MAKPHLGPDFLPIFLSLSDLEDVGYAEASLQVGFIVQNVLLIVYNMLSPRTINSRSSLMCL
jgi:hypothetical protein